MLHAVKMTVAHGLKIVALLGGGEPSVCVDAAPNPGFGNPEGRPLWGVLGKMVEEMIRWVWKDE